MAEVIRTTALTKKFGKTSVVDHLDMGVKEGTITAFLGPNGAGKTTTIRMLLGLLSPHAGTCEVLGYPPGHIKALAQMGALVETPSLYGHLTGRENLEITRLLKSCPRSEVERVLVLVGLAAHATRPVRTYSLGMRQRLGIALALLGEPRLLILDEPTNGLDPVGIQEMRELIRSLPARMGTTVFLSSHLLAEVEQVATELVVLHEGHLRYQGPLKALVSSFQQELVVRVGDWEKGTSLLRAHGFAVRHDQDFLRIEAARESVPHIANMLIENGIAIYEISPLRSDLETCFLALLQRP